MKLSDFFLSEMARPKGSYGATWRAAMESARQYGQEFTVKQFCQWLVDAGVDPKSANPASVGIRMSRMIAGEGERPGPSAPLVVVKAPRRGLGGAGTYRYAFDGPIGADAPDPDSVVQKPKQDDAPQHDFDLDSGDDDEGGWEEAGDDDEQEPEPAPPPAKKIAPSAQAPARKSGGWPQWLPKADPDGSFEESEMSKLLAAGKGPDDPIWDALGKAHNDVEAHDIIKKSLPPQLQRAAIRVAKAVFANLNKDWDAPSQGGKLPTRSVPVQQPDEPVNAGEDEGDEEGQDDSPEMVFQKEPAKPTPDPKIQQPPAKKPEEPRKKSWNPFSHVTKRR